MEYLRDAFTTLRTVLYGAGIAIAGAWLLHRLVLPDPWQLGTGPSMVMLIVAGLSCLAARAQPTLQVLIDPALRRLCWTSGRIGARRLVECDFDEVDEVAIRSEAEPSRSDDYAPRYWLGIRVRGHVLRLPVPGATDRTAMEQHAARYRALFGVPTDASPAGPIVVDVDALISRGHLEEAVATLCRADGFTAEQAQAEVRTRRLFQQARSG